MAKRAKPRTLAGCLNTTDATFKHHLFVPKGPGVTAQRIRDAMFDFAGESAVRAMPGGWAVHFDDVKFCDPRREVVSAFLALMESSRHAFDAKFHPIPSPSKDNPV